MKTIKKIYCCISDKYQEIHDFLCQKFGILWLMVLVATVTIIATYLAIWIRQHFPGVIIGSKDEPIFQPWMVLPGLAHAIIAGEQIAKVSAQKNNIINAKLLFETGYIEKAREVFILNAFIRINVMNKGILFLTSMVFYFQFLTFPFEDQNTLIKVIGTTICVLYGLWAGAMEIDDEFHGIHKTSMEEAKILLGEEKFKILFSKR